MAQQIAVFNFHGSQIRTIEHDGGLWFIGKDVAEVLGYTNTRKAVADHCKAAIPAGSNGSLPLLDPQTIIIPERDVYRLVMRSKLPSAEKFEEWVTGEVLPSIRKTGSYSMQPQELIARAVIEAQKLIDHQAAKIAELAPRAAIADRIQVAGGRLCIREAAKALKVQERKLVLWLLEHKWLYRDMKGKLRGYSDKTPRYIEHKITPIPTDDDAEKVSLQAMITPEGITRLAGIFNVEIEMQEAA